MHTLLLSALSQVNNNGVVSFSEPVSTYTPDAIPLTNGEAFAATFWADVNNILGGEVYWRQTQDPEFLAKVSTDMNLYFPNTTYVAKWALVATWDRVAYFGSASQKVRPDQLVHPQFPSEGHQWSLGLPQTAEKDVPFFHCCSSTNPTKRWRKARNTQQENSMKCQICLNLIPSVLVAEKHFPGCPDN